jgi:hypothetical protein
MERWNKPVNGNSWTGVKLKFPKVFIPNSNCCLQYILCCFRHGEDIRTIAYCYFCGVQMEGGGEEVDSVPWFETFAVFWTLYSFFWVISQRLNCICWSFGTLSFPFS